MNEEPVFCRLRSEHEVALARFFLMLRHAGVTRHFHPHGFDAAAARERSQYEGQDEYHVAIEDGEIVAYGMLRGWDEGYEMPSLGIVVHPERQGQGLGRRMMAYLHATAEARGARRVRLKVYRKNERAIALYRSLGYVFQGQEGDQLVGVKEF